MFVISEMADLIPSDLDLNVPSSVTVAGWLTFTEGSSRTAGSTFPPRTDLGNSCSGGAGAFAKSNSD